MKKPFENIIHLYLIFRVVCITWPPETPFIPANPNSRVHGLQASHITFPDLSHRFTLLMAWDPHCQRIGARTDGELVFGGYGMYDQFTRGVVQVVRVAR